MVELLIENKEVVGVIVKRYRTPVKVIGVLLCTGGCAYNTRIRQTNKAGPISDQQTSVLIRDNDDAVKAGEKVGAALALMDDVWQGPTFKNLQTSERHSNVVERSLPYSIILDSQGKRFINEAQ